MKYSGSAMVKKKTCITLAENRRTVYTLIRIPRGSYIDRHPERYVIPYGSHKSSSFVYSLFSFFFRSPLLYRLFVFYVAVAVVVVLRFLYLLLGGGFLSFISVLHPQCAACEPASLRIIFCFPFLAFLFLCLPFFVSLVLSSPFQVRFRFYSSTSILLPSRLFFFVPVGITIYHAVSSVSFTAYHTYNFPTCGHLNSFAVVRGTRFVSASTPVIQQYRVDRSTVLFIDNNVLLLRQCSSTFHSTSVIGACPVTTDCLVVAIISCCENHT